MERPGIYGGTNELVGPHAHVGLFGMHQSACTADAFQLVLRVLRPVTAQIGSDTDYRSRGLNVSELTETLRK